MLSSWMATVSSRTDGTCLAPLSTSALARSAGGSSPWAIGTASSAAVSAIWMIGWYTVISCSPERMRWTPASSASWPVTKRLAGSMPADFSAAIAPPAIPSLATYTASKPSSPSEVTDCSISCWARSGLQSGVS